jgi:hypothetical protein
MHKAEWSTCRKKNNLEIWSALTHFSGAVNDAGSSSDHIMSKPMCTCEDDIKMNTKNRV